MVNLSIRTAIDATSSPERSFPYIILEGSFQGREERHLYSTVPIMHYNPVISPLMNNKRHQNVTIPKVGKR